MASIVSAGTTSATALNMSADTTGVLSLASNNGVVALIIDASQNIGVNSASSTIRTKLMASSSNANDAYTLGTVSGAFSVTNSNTNYGLQFGSFSTGNSWIQSARMDGTATAYNLILQPGGGNVGIGTSSPASASGVAFVVHDTSTPRIRLTSTTTGQASSDGAELSLSGSNFYIENREAQDIVFYSGSERMRITSGGSLCIGRTSNIFGSGAGLCVESSANTVNAVVTTSSQSALSAVNTAVNTGTSCSLMSFNVGISSGGSQVGTITYNGTATLYNSTSDQRLKKNIVDAGSGLAKLANVKIRAFDWIEHDNHTDFGVVAQELVTVAPEAVSAGDTGETIERTWAVDTSNLVPAMIKAIQELNAKVTALENK
jgi:hypothetical protein